MKNVIFFIFFLILLMGIRKSNGSLATLIPLIGGLIFVITGAFFPVIWEWSRKYSDSGLLSYRFLSVGEVNIFRVISLWGALGCLFAFFSTQIILQTFRTQLCSVFTRDYRSDSKQNNYLGKHAAIVGIITILLYFIGLGKSIFATEVYLESKGNLTIHRLAGTLAAGAIVLLILGSSKNKFANINSVLLLILFVILLGKGSRLSTILLAAIFVAKLLSSSIGFFRKIFYFNMTFFAIVLGINMNNLSRGKPTGIIFIPRMFNDLISDLHTPNSMVIAIGKALASITSWVPTVIASVGTISARKVLANMNPLIGTGSDPYDFTSEGVERLFPYIWTPLSSLGQFYGIGGGLLIALIAFFTASFASMAFVYSKRNRLELFFSSAAAATYFISFLILFQYSTRNWSRLFWTLIFLTFMHLLKSFGFSNRDYILKNEYL